jgi:hypothetical protein
MSMMPRTAEDVLAIPEDDVPDTIRCLLAGRSLSDLITRLHAALLSNDVTSGARARAALIHLGFVI